MADAASAEMAAALWVNERAPLLAQAAVARQVHTGQDGSQELVRGRAVQDARYHFAFLAHALEFSRPELFARYAQWAQSMLAHRGTPPADFAQQLEQMALAVEAQVPGDGGRHAARYVRDAIASLDGATASIDDAIGHIPVEAQRYLDALLARDTEAARRHAIDALRHGMGAGELYLQMLAPALREVGLLWQAGRLSVADEHYCVGVTQMVIGHVSSSITAVRGRRTAVVACVEGEEHAIGSRMVADFLDMSGWRTLWLGAGTPTGDLLRMVVELKADLLALSCTYAPSLHEVASLISAVRAMPECRHVKVLVGGHAFAGCPELWRDVRADAYAEDAAQAARIAQALVN